MLTLTVALERLELVAGRYSQIAESCRRIEVFKLLARPLLYLSVETLDEFAAKYRFRPLVLERSDHLSIVTHLVPTVQLVVGKGRHRHRDGCESDPGVRTVASGSARMGRR